MSLTKLTSRRVTLNILRRIVVACDKQTRRHNVYNSICRRRCISYATLLMRQ